MLQLELPHVNVLSKVDLIETYGKLSKHMLPSRRWLQMFWSCTEHYTCCYQDFSLEYYTEVMDLSYLLESLNADAFGKKYQKLNKALCDLIEDFSLVGFYTLCVEVRFNIYRMTSIDPRSYTRPI